MWHEDSKKQSVMFLGQICSLLEFKILFIEIK
jgi:hypothetical protein